MNDDKSLVIISMRHEIDSTDDPLRCNVHPGLGRAGTGCCLDSFHVNGCDLGKVSYREILEGLGKS